MKRWMIAAVLFLPVAGLGLLASWHSWRMVNAVEWRIPISGYDPRDLLAGQYALFQYRWDVRGDTSLCRGAECVLCLSHADAGRVVAQVQSDDGGHCSARVDPVASNLSLRPIGPNMMTATTRIYIPEHDADRINAILASDKQAVLVAQLNKDGRLVPQRIEKAQ